MSAAQRCGLSTASLAWIPPTVGARAGAKPAHPRLAEKCRSTVPPATRLPALGRIAERFNEAIDQALAESIAHFHMQVERNRNLLLGMLGHDLRSPLQSIQTTAAYLTALNAGAEVSEAAARLINSDARMKALLDDLLDFNRAKLGVGIRVRPAEIESAAVLTDELNLLRAAHPARRIELTVVGDTRGVWTPCAWGRC